MTAVQEIQATLAMMKDIRKFFLDSDHSEEINRLRDFVGLCNELKALKENGTIDAISDTILKLSVKQ